MELEFELNSLPLESAVKQYVLQMKVGFLFSFNVTLLHRWGSELQLRMVK